MEMTSHGSQNGGSGQVVAATVDTDETRQGVQSLKALSLNGLNREVFQMSSANDLKSKPSSASNHDGIPKPRLSWGDITEIPGGSASSMNRPFKKHRKPFGGAISSSGNAWQVRPTQNPSRPLVRRPTPIAIKIPKSVLGKGSSNLTVSSFEEEEEIEEDEDDTVPILLKDASNADVLVLRDVGDELQQSTPKDLPLKQFAGDHVSSEPQSLGEGSPTIVVQTDHGKQLSPEEADVLQKKEDDLEDEEGKELDDKSNAEVQFLSPNKTSSYGKNPDPQASNSHIQTVPHQHKKLVRRATPLALDVPKNTKCLASVKTHDEILEEEDDDDDDDDEDEEEEEQQVVSEEEAITTGQPDLINSVNNNNNHEASALDLVERDVAHDAQFEYQGRHGPTTTHQLGRRFTKSVSKDKNDGSRSPSSARRKVSQHHTKILTRKPTPLQIEVAKSVLTESMRSKATYSALEEDDEEI